MGKTPPGEGVKVGNEGLVRKQVHLKRGSLARARELGVQFRRGGGGPQEGRPSTG